ncbi:MAG: hypothetical protein HC803_11125 [Saprospiraceae bacterium]|nr:hypothetical protein [Saprospiraceae bacterium]
MLLAIALYHLLQFIKQEKYHSIVVITIALAISETPYYRIYEQNSTYFPKDNLEQDGFAVRSIAAKYPDIKTYKVLLKVEYIEHIDQVNFYIKTLEKYKNFQIKIIDNFENIKIGDLIICSQEAILSELEMNYKIEIIDTFERSKFLRVIEEK